MASKTDKLNKRIEDAWTRLLENAAFFIAIPFFALEWFKRHDKIRKWLIRLGVLTGLTLWIFGPQGLAFIMALGSFAAGLLYAVGFMVIQFGALFWFMSRTRLIEVHPGDAKAVTFDDYWGQPTLVANVRHWNKLLSQRERFEAMGGKALNGIMLVGPPGTGKTWLAKAMAGEEGVGFIGTEGSSFRAMFWGVDSQPLDERILTPTGWTTMGDIEIGDQIIGRDGKAHNVLEVHDVGEKQIYRITFKDGAIVRASDTHKWWVRDWSSRIRGRPEYGKETLKSTIELVCEVGRRDAIACPKPVEFPERSLPLPPYLMGAMIGNGTFRGGTPVLSNSEMELIEQASEIAKDSYGREFPVKDLGQMKTLTLSWGQTPKSNPITDKLRALGLWGLSAKQKFIPGEYLFASVAQRVALLQGLLDTDGSISQKGSIRFSTTSESLCSNIVELVNGLGGRAKKSRRSYDGRSESWDVYIVLPDEVKPFTLSRKMARISNKIGEYHLCRFIETVELEGEQEARCLETDAPDELYLTESYVLTHNTMKMMAFVAKARMIAKRYGACIAYIDEIDAVAQSRSGVMGGSGGGGQVIGGGGGGGLMGGGQSGALTRLLYEMDGLDEIPEFDIAQNRARKLLGLPMIFQGQVMFMGATNRPDTVDPALLRPGRFDQTIVVDIPDEGSRREVINGYLGRIVHDEDVDIEALVANTAGATPALIMSVITKMAVRNAIFADHDSVSQHDLEMAFLEKMVGLQSPIENWDPAEKRSVAAHESGHVIAMRYLRPHKHVAWVSIVRRGQALGFALDLNPSDVYAYPIRHWKQDILVGLAGNAAVEMIMGEEWTGMGGDMLRVRGLVGALISQGSFTDKRGAKLFPMADPTSVNGSGGSELTDAVNRFMNSANESIRNLLQQHRPALELLTDRLFEAEDLTGAAAFAIMDEAEPIKETA